MDVFLESLTPTRWLFLLLTLNAQKGMLLGLVSGAGLKADKLVLNKLREIFVRLEAHQSLT